MTGLGHNNGPSMDEGVTGRRHAWAKARAELLPTLPIEVLRLRVARARALGLDYRTYAGVRAASGRDVVAVLFSSNALRLHRPGDRLPEDRRLRLLALDAERLGLLHRPLDPARVLAATPLDAAARAPAPFARWSEARDALRAFLRERGAPADGTLLVGETAAEREWSEAARLAGHLTGERYFAARAT